MIISVHMPKTAGNSFEAALRAGFGDGLRSDYETYPINTPPVVRCRAALEGALANFDTSFEGVRCIHGHFLPVRYLALALRADVTFVTWLRHPVQRLVSHYNFWRRNYDEETAQPLHRRVVEEQWSLERFCLSHELRDLYTQFLWAFPVDNFSFIGITEHFAEDLSSFSRRYLGMTVAAQRLNANPAAGHEHDVGPALRNRIETWHSKDMALYAQALALRRMRGAD